VTRVQDTSAVEIFEDWHDRGPEEGHGADERSVFRSLLPATAPGAGAQYRFEVDLDRCTGCKACVSACHSLNGLDGEETWRAVGLLVGGGARVEPSRSPAPSVPKAQSAPVWQQHVTTACHHCIEPACLAGCPVDAYEKDPITGIVAHLDDQCIGCRYCMLTCPYEVPTFNDRLGIVRKCDMCSDRLAVGEAPACVQGCPTSAISIGVVDVAELTAELAANPESRMVPTGPRSAHTGPTTVYLTARKVPADATAADDHRVVPASNHPPLVAMLVLTQLSVGAFILLQILERSGGPFGHGRGAGATPAVIAWGVALVALGASVLHLGRPIVAWRAVLGLRRSWLSREILAFGVYAILGGVTAAAAAGLLPRNSESGLGLFTAAVGLFGVVCSAKVYSVTARPFWRLDRTVIRFVVTMGITGAAGVAVAVSATEWIGDGRAGEAGSVTRAVAPLVVGETALALVALAMFLLRHRGSPGALGRSTWLLTGPLRGRTLTGVALVVTGAIVATILWHTTMSPGASSAWWAIVLVLTTAAAWIERGLFFTAAAPDRMPGGFH
jgi:formate dehydrogenase iron-sulfur subunit